MEGLGKIRDRPVRLPAERHRRHDDDRDGAQRRISGPLCEHRPAIGPGHHEIEKDQIHVAGTAKDTERLSAVARLDDAVALDLEEMAPRLGDPRLILHDQYASWHADERASRFRPRTSRMNRSRPRHFAYCRRVVDPITQTP